jgi:hypothetical protein
MASIIGWVNDVGYFDASDVVRIHGIARCEGMDDTSPNIQWEVLIDPDTLAATINSTIKSTMVTAAGDAGWTVGILDKKTLLGVAVGL